MSGVGDREWNAEYRELAALHDPIERALRSIYSAQIRGEITKDEAETLQRIVSPPRPGWHAWQRPLWRRW